MASSGPSSLLGDLFNLAKEIAQAFFGSATQEIASLPAPAPSPLPKHARSVRVKQGRRQQAKRQKIIDLTSDSDDVEIVEVRQAVRVIDLASLPDPTPDEIEQEAALNRKKTALTFQYATKLDIGPVNKDIRLKKMGQDSYQLQSTAFAKYKPKSQANTLEQLVSLTETMELRDARMLLRNEWLNDTLIDKYFTLLENSYPNTRVISSLLSDKIDFFDKVRQNQNYIKDRAGLKAAKRIFMPMNANNHWYLVVLDKDKDGKYTLSCMDSFNTNTDRFLNIASGFLQALYPGKKLANLVKKQQHVPILNQHNGLDCGVAISYWAREIAKKNALPTSPKGTCDYSQFRFDMAEDFARDQTKKLEKEKPIKILGPGGILN